MSRTTQSARVLASLKAAGPRGITQVDWLGPETWDGGPPIQRLAAKVWDLRRDGHAIAHLEERRHKNRVYVLLETTGPGPEPDGGEELPKPTPLFPEAAEPARKPLTPYEFDTEEAA